MTGANHLSRRFGRDFALRGQEENEPRALARGGIVRTYISLQEKPILNTHYHKLKAEFSQIDSCKFAKPAYR